MNLVQYRARLCVGVSLLLLLLVLGVIVGALVKKTLWVEETLQSVEPRFARLLGIQVSAGAINQAMSEAEGVLSRYTYPSTTGADRIGTDLQQRLRAAAEAAGVAVTGSQIVAGKAENRLEDILVAMTFEADLEQLNTMLEIVSAQTPAVFVEGLTLQPLRRTGSEARLLVQVRFSVLRRIP